MERIEIARKFLVEGEFVSEEQILSGHINQTFKFVFNNNGENNAYILQRMNKYVFKNPIKLMENIYNVTSYIAEKLEKEGIDSSRKVLHFHHTKEGLYYFEDEEHEFWRLYDFVKGSVCFNDVSSNKILTEGGKAFGYFMNQLSAFDASSLDITIKDFHNTCARYDQLREAVKNNKAGRLEEVKTILEQYLDFEEIACKMTVMLQNGELPLRVTHNDTKCNNVLFDEVTEERLAVIDLDTIMPGLLGFDFGDAIRTAGNTAKEDEPDFTKVSLDLDKFRAFAEGYIPTVKESITKNELDTLALGAISMTVECGTRFLADYLNGDVYFHTNYDKHNLVRCIGQLTLAKNMLEKYPQMVQIVNDIYNR